MQKRLFRSRTEKKLGGVCGGIAEYFEVDPVWVRIAFVLITVMHGAGILVYIACLVLIPLEPFVMSGYQPKDTSKPEGSFSEPLETTTINEKKNSDKIGARNIFGGILVVIGTLLLFDNLIPSFDFEEIFPVILIIFGIWLLINPFNKGQQHEL